METIKNEVLEQIAEFSKLSDYELRPKTIGAGITACIFAKKYFEVGTENYKELYMFVFEQLKGLYNRAWNGVNKYSIEATYTAKTCPVSFGYSTVMEERTEEEAKQRFLAKTFQNLNTKRTIKKPIFTKLQITQN